MSATRPGAVPAWITPGTPVVVFTPGGHNRGIIRSVIDRVAGRSFTVEGSEDRFSVTDRCHRDGGFTRRVTTVLPVDSTAGRAKLREAESWKLSVAAARACETWIRTRTEGCLLAAITALEAVRDGEDGR